MQSSTDHLSYLSYYGYDYSRKRRPVPGGASMSYLVQVQRGSTESAASFDAETGRIGTYEAKFLIPNLNKEEKRIPTSSVVLSSPVPNHCCVESSTVKKGPAPLRICAQS